MINSVGCFSIVIESVPQKIAEYITEILNIPTIGIGAGPKTDGQILVWHDMLGLFSDFSPKFTKRYANLRNDIVSALNVYKKEVGERSFPGKEHIYKMKQVEWDKFREKYNIPKLPSQQKTEKPRKKVVIIGAGSMGCLMASQIVGKHYPESKYDFDLHVLSSWEEHVNRINNEGLKVVMLDGSTKNYKVKASTSPEEIIKDGPADIVFIMVKSPQTKVASEKARILLGDHPFRNNEQVVVTMQNGLGNFEILHQCLSSNVVNGYEPRILQGVTNHGGAIVDAGKVRHTGLGKSIIHGNTGHAHVELIQNLFRNSNFPIEISQDLDEVIWNKLVVNAAINPLTALMQVTNGELAMSTEGQLMIERIVEETVSVAKARGININYNDSLKNTKEVLQKTSQNRSSMLQDLQRGVRTEIDAINGSIVEWGEKLGIDVTWNKRLVDLLKEPSSRAKSMFRITPKEFFPN
eukprot:TRINITY_DN163_c0_g1_i1.p1 TRINITY_DN163_c0_g1~~TRINITY_DN163_c0_g1_i1.p1  ORF type:complete len:465 (-),score=116.16 TRINITY_DN163_c0_g1_i1:46-1440(-)